jgi:hypothetical protein
VFGFAQAAQESDREGICEADSMLQHLVRAIQISKKRMPKKTLLHKPSYMHACTGPNKIARINPD